MANSMRAMKPAQFVLDHKAELALAPEQVSFLEFLVVAHRDSTIARQARLITLTQVTMAKRPSGGPLGASSWEGKVDEGMIREGACEQSVVQAEMMINLVRDRHAVGGVLTPAQLARLPMVEANDMMKAMKKP